MREIDEGPFPRGALAGAAALVLFALLMAGAVRTGVFPAAANPETARAEAGIAAVKARDLSFADTATGEVLVRDMGTGEVVARLEGGPDQGFVRGVLRSLARERRMHGVGSEPPFRLTLWGNGELSLVDSATGRSIELGAFGPDNRAAFMQLIGDKA